MSEKKPIEVDIKLIEPDFWRVSFASRIKRFLLVTAIYLPVAILIIYFAAFGAGANPFSENNWSVLIVLFIIVIIPFVFLPSAYFSLRKLARKLAKASEDTHFIFSENGIETTSSSRSSKSSWGNYEKIQETKEDFVCYLSNFTFYPIPKRCFKNEQQINEFQEIVRENLGSKAILK